MKSIKEKIPLRGLISQLVQIADHARSNYLPPDNWVMLLILVLLFIKSTAYASNEIQDTIDSGFIRNIDSAPEELIGIVFAARALNLVSEIDGRVASIPVQLGQSVNQQASLIELESPWLQHDLEIAKVNEALAKAKLTKTLLERELAFDRRDRRLKLTDTWSAEERAAVVLQAKMADVDVTLAEAQLDQETARINHLTSRLQKTHIRAPFKGVVSARYVEKGELVNSGQPMLRLITDSELGVRFGVPERLIDTFCKDIQLQAYFPVKNKRVDLSITHLAPEIDLSTGLATAEGALRIPNEMKGQILPGMAVRVLIGQQATN